MRRTQLRTPDGWQVPDTIGEFLTDLTELSAPGNRITGLPLNLERCRFAIVSVDLERNRLTALPPVLLRLTRLTRLGLSDNELRELPLELGRLLYLKDLTVPTTDLGSVPLSVVSAGGKAVIRYMCGLEECSDTGLLDFSGMNLDFLPPAVRGTTSALTMLKLDDNPLERVPNWLGEFQRLRRISLRRTPIVRLPATLGAIQSLEEVVVDEGSDVLLSPPPEVVAFGSQGIVSYLRRSYSAVVYRQLDLSGFGLTRIPFQALSSPSVLTSLALNNNALESLPLELAQLHGLKMLALAGNRLASLPLAVFPPLTALRSLSLKDNPLEALPLTLGACSLLEFLDYDAAAIASPPRDVVVKSVSAVRVYLRQAWLGRSTGRLDLSSLELTDVPLEATAWSPLLRPPSAPAPAPASAAASVAKEEGAGAESAADAGAEDAASREEVERAGVEDDGAQDTHGPAAAGRVGGGDAGGTGPGRRGAAAADMGAGAVETYGNLYVDEDVERAYDEEPDVAPSLLQEHPAAAAVERGGDGSGDGGAGGDAVDGEASSESESDGSSGGGGEEELAAASSVMEEDGVVWRAVWLLDLSGNGIASLREELGRMAALRRLDVSRNELKR